MPRATCRCGQPLDVPETGEGAARVVCPSCGAKVKVRLSRGSGSDDDGYLRFHCPCGRRLKVDAANPPAQGKCPDCGRVVPVPATRVQARATLPPGHPETPTEDLTPADAAALDRWSRGHLARAVAGATPSTTDLVSRPPPIEADRAEVGLRVCPTCGRPVHLGAETCRGCGTPVPRR